MNGKSFNILNLRLFVEIFLELWSLTILKVCIAYRHWRSKFPRSGKNQNTKSYLALVRIFLVAELKSATGRFGAGRLWPCIWANFFWATEKSITKNLWIISYAHFFFVMIQRIFSSWALLPSHFTTFFWRIVNPYSFHVLIKSAFLFFSARAYCVHNKQNNSEWLLVVMKFLSPCLAQYLTHLLCSPVRCRVIYEKRNPISMRARVSFSVSLDQKKLWQMKRIDTTKRKKHDVYIQEGRTYSLRETWEAFCHFAAIFHKFIWFLRLGSIFKQRRRLLLKAGK